MVNPEIRNPKPSGSLGDEQTHYLLAKKQVTASPEQVLIPKPELPFASHRDKRREWNVSKQKWNLF